MPRWPRPSPVTLPPPNKPLQLPTKEQLKTLSVKPSNLPIPAEPPKPKPPCWWVGPEFKIARKACMMCDLEELWDKRRVESKTGKIHPASYCPWSPS